MESIDILALFRLGEDMNRYTAAYGIFFTWRIYPTQERVKNIFFTYKISMARDEQPLLSGMIPG